MIGFDTRGFQSVPFSFGQSSPGFGFGALPGTSNFGFGAVGGGVQMAQITQVLQQLLQGLSQLAGAWSGMLSGSPNGSPFASQPAQIGGFPGQGFPVQNQPFPYQPFQNQPFPGGGFYGGGPVQTQPGQGGYNGTSGLLGSVGAPPTPSDPQEFASYLQAQRLGGTLEGKTGIAQRDAIPGTRFGQVANSEAWQSSLARNYAYQFAAYATGADALTPQGMQKGQQAFNNMSNDARLFMQVAAVFKGNLLNGPGFYNNPGLKQLLLSHGLGDLANQPGVGETDVQSIGAITKALNSGQLTLDQVISSGTIDNLDRYHQVINYVQGGNFNNALNFYDNVQI